jgi:hypothetical protein
LLVEIIFLGVLSPEFSTVSSKASANEFKGFTVARKPEKWLWIVFSKIGNGIVIGKALS